MSVIAVYAFIKFASREWALFYLRIMSIVQHRQLTHFAKKFQSVTLNDKFCRKSNSLIIIGPQLFFKFTKLAR